MVTIEITTTGIDFGQLSRHVKEIVIPRLVSSVTRFAMGEMEKRAPAKTGTLRWSIKMATEGYEGEVGPTVPHAIYVVSGTAPHQIRPVHAQALRFEVNGGVVFSRLVNHPGTKPNPFMRESMEAALDEVPRIWEEIFRKELIE